MNRKIFVLLSAMGLSSASFSQTQTGQFDFSNVNSSTNVQNFSTSNGFSMYVNGLYSQTALNQNLSSLTLNATAYNLATVGDGGIGTGPFGDGELRNGAGTPKLSGASILELSDILAPSKGKVTDVTLNLSSVDRLTNEGFLVYGSTGNAYFGGPTKLTLLDHGKGGPGDIGTFDLNSSILSKYSTFYVTADNSYFSSVGLGGATVKAQTQTTPEPMTMLGFACAGIPLLRRRKKNS